MLLDNANEFDTIDYVYVVDGNSVLKGVVSIKELYASNKDVSVEGIMKKKLVVARPLTHQERIVYLALSNRIKAIPVVDKQSRLLGIVPYDTILQIFNEEVREDIFKFGGIFHKIGKEYTTIKSSALTMVKTRLPWLAAKTLAHLLKYDTVHGRLPFTVEARKDTIIVDGKELKVLAEPDPANLPWKKLDIYLSIESREDSQTEKEPRDRSTN